MILLWKTELVFIQVKDKIFLFVSALTVVVIEYKIKDTYKGLKFCNIESHFYFYKYP